MRIDLGLELTEHPIVRLSEDEDGYKEKLAAVKEAGYWFDPVCDCWTKPEPLVDEVVQLQYFGSEGVALDRYDTATFRKMLFFLLENGFEYEDESDRWFRPKDRARYSR